MNTELAFKFQKVMVEGRIIFIGIFNDHSYYER
jgi:hypothetical protein